MKMAHAERVRQLKVKLNVVLAQARRLRLLGVIVYASLKILLQIQGC